MTDATQQPEGAKPAPASPPPSEPPKDPPPKDASPKDPPPAEANGASPTNLGDKEAARRQKARTIDLSKPEVLREVRRQFAESAREDTEESPEADAKFVELIRTYIHGNQGSAFTGNIEKVEITNIYGAPPPPGGTAAADTPPPDVPWPASAFAACEGEAAALAFLMSAAILDGGTMAAVRRAAGHLADRLLSSARRARDTPQLRMLSIDRYYPAFRLRAVREAMPDDPEATVERVRFQESVAATEVLAHAWFRLLGIPDWTRHVTEWLAQLGKDESLEIRIAAGQAAGILWAAGSKEIDAEVARVWYGDASTRPLDALDACYVAGALASSALRRSLGDRLRTWGHISHGIDDVFALCHLSTRRYRIVDAEACFKGLEALLAQNNLLGLLHAQDSYERLLAIAIDDAPWCDKVADSLQRAMNTAAKEKNETLKLQVIMVGLSLLEAERGKGDERAPLLDQLLAKITTPTKLATFFNTISAGSRMQAPVIRALREIFMRATANCASGQWLDSAPLRLFALMHSVGSATDRERLEYYLADWAVAAAEKSAVAGAAARSTLDHMQGIRG